MRRTDREITDLAALRTILEQGTFCTLSLFDGAYPYAVPLNYGWEEREGRVALYFHCAKEGKKLELIRNNPRAAFSIVCNPQVPRQEQPCAYTCFYESVCGAGTLRFLEGEAARKGLAQVVAHYALEKVSLLPTGGEQSVCVLQLEVERLTGKRHR